ncbi:phosphate ABC transporter permease PstA [Neomegalonema sp.]|uniref:phosphate ABC transporter permease PstA n=1 Tax=Neomegalonema sp. TaxID=2039713 RepID=UPI00345C2A31
MTVVASPDLPAGSAEAGRSASLSPHMTEAAARRLRSRRAADLRLRIYGLAAIGFAALALVALLWSTFGKAGAAMTAHSVVMSASLPAAQIDPQGLGTPEALRRGDYQGVVRNAMQAEFPGVTDRAGRRELAALLSSGAPDDLREQVVAGDLALDQPVRLKLLASDDADLYFKGYYGRLTDLPAAGVARVAEAEGVFWLTLPNDEAAPVLAALDADLRAQATTLRAQAEAQQRGVTHHEGLAAGLAGAQAEANRASLDGFAARRDELLAQAAALEAQADAPGASGILNPQIPSFLFRTGESWARVAEAGPQGLRLEPLTGVAAGDSAQGAWGLYETGRPSAGRRVSDRQIAMLETLETRGEVESGFNWRFFTSSDSREAELAGVKGAIIGSFWTLLVTFLFAFPIGVSAAIYLEEFAPKNRLTNFIEVNINNLAAVPSIVFGLLGLSVFLNFLGMPRSAPLVGGLVLGLMTLPVVIIASRAAIRAVPPSIRDGALGLGASRMQATFHHVLPLAMPGIMTGAIIGMAQALGETAPLIMIGMVAFIVDTPTGVTSPATVLPVQIFRWADFPERAFEFRTAAAIVTLLGFLIIMNAAAVLVRRRFERRW